MAKVFVSIKDIDHAQFKWVDTRFSLQDADEGKQKYTKSHVTGAVYWDLERDLSDMTKSEGRHPMPDKSALIELFRTSGFSIDDQIIVYDDGGSPFATRAWWLLQYAGFKSSFIALEGFEAMTEAGFPVDNRTTGPQRTLVSPQWDETIYAPRQFVEETVAGKTASVLLDARSAERYRGDNEPIDPIAGRIPGALNFDWEQLRKEGIFNLDVAVKEQLHTVVKPAAEVTVYCGSGVTAAPLYALLKHNGYETARLYVGSYSDWISQKEGIVEKD
ncbi:rhodanese-like domain-containing protein [Sporosarcina sp. E16_8]|uniref:sulfurtransferase n=1 Tax=Sporosarcina sp. E16_8 TaxID=2789295 RepID=UPI001A9198B4|nr:rhodanese-like domain-containing protein [Sporosarcina sp. E16_8]MBO0586537.1 sulfurtransferase [Sporosarcina sp. E16_8]